MITDKNKTFTTSVAKFAFFNFITLGLYMAYWGWKYWEVMKRTQKLQVNSTVRGLFIIFTGFSLYPQILKAAKEKGYTQEFNGKALAGGILAVTIISNLLTASPDVSFGLWFAVSISSFIAVVAIAAPIINAMNFFAAHTDQVVRLKTNWGLIALLVSLVVLLFAYGFI